MCVGRRSGSGEGAWGVEDLSAAGMPPEFQDSCLRRWAPTGVGPTCRNRSGSRPETRRHPRCIEKRPVPRYGSRSGPHGRCNKSSPRYPERRREAPDSRQREVARRRGLRKAETARQNRSITQPRTTLADHDEREALDLRPFRIRPRSSRVRPRPPAPRSADSGSAPDSRSTGRAAGPPSRADRWRLRRSKSRRMVDVHPFLGGSAVTAGAEPTLDLRVDTLR